MCTFSQSSFIISTLKIIAQEHHSVYQNTVFSHIWNCQFKFSKKYTFWRTDMLFNSYIFILVFLPLCLAGYFLLNRLKFFTLAQCFLLGMSLWFYGYFNWGYLRIMIASILINYLTYLAIRYFQNVGKMRMKKLVFIAGELINVGILIYFKYMDFFIRTFNRIADTNLPLLEIVLPLGISFFTFQQISFVVDAYRGEVPDYNLLEYACFVSFFSQLIAGPIVTHDELVPQFRDMSKKHIIWENLSRGIYIFVLGLSKKVLLADVFGQAANFGFENVSRLDATNAILTMLAYTLQIYFDFSGYCDMAIGTGKMLNIDIPLNFNSPYKALTITEFWDRWHMTLTRFFTKYVYIPLGGNRKGELRTYLNVFIVFFISGFWHGAGFAFIFWGVCHGLFSIITRKYRRFFKQMHPALNWIITFGFVNVMWVFFRAPSLRTAVRLLNRIAIFRFGPINGTVLSYFKLPEIEFILSRLPQIERIYPYFTLMIFFAFALYIVLGCKNTYEKMQAFKPSVLNLSLTAFLAVWCIFSFTGESTFLYFNF